MKIPRISVALRGPGRCQERGDHRDDAGNDEPEHRLQPGALGPGDARLPLEVDLSCRRIVDAGDDVEERGLAGSIGADQADDRLLGDREVDVIDREQAAEPLGDLGGVQDFAHG